MESAWGLESETALGPTLFSVWADVLRNLTGFSQVSQTLESALLTGDTLNVHKGLYISLHTSPSPQSRKPHWFLLQVSTSMSQQDNSFTYPNFYFFTLFGLESPIVTPKYTPRNTIYTKFKDRSNESMVSEFKTVSPWYRIGGRLMWWVTVERKGLPVMLILCFFIWMLVT